MKRLMILLIILLFVSGCYAGDNETVSIALNNELVEETGDTNMEEATIEPIQTVEVTPIATLLPTTTPTVIPTEEVTATPRPTAVITAAPTENKPTAVPTPEPTVSPSYTVISSSIRSGALQGINDGREEEGNPPASFSSSLNSKAEAHAIAMAKTDSLYHSSMGYVESVRSGANIGGWSEGYAATCHATQLATKADITQIGVGSAVSSDGTVYTCIIGN